MSNDFDREMRDNPERMREAIAELLRDERAAMEARLRAAQAAAWAEGAQIGFHSTMEGFNGECMFDHCAPDDYPPTNPYSGEKWEVSDWAEPA